MTASADPTPDAVRRGLAELLGWSVAPGQGPYGFPPPPDCGPDGDRMAYLPDPAADLNAMAAVEAALADDQRWAYLSYLAGGSPAEGGWQHDLGGPALWRMATAPAAVRALAAWRVLVAAKDGG